MSCLDTFFLSQEAVMRHHSDVDDKYRILPSSSAQEEAFSPSLPDFTVEETSFQSRLAVVFGDANGGGKPRKHFHLPLYG
jgi:hypothetical protein